jgi:4-amino-4-deoxy-L-arabinose transferase-like glycosyltransferase
VPNLHREHGFRVGFLMLLFLGLIFIADSTLNAIEIGFPIYWHADEVSKATQIISGTYNFYHPQLLLRLAKIFRKLFSFDGSMRDTVLAGRYVSVVATAAATTIAALLVARRFGKSFGLLTAVLVGATPAIFLSAHFFKEDATLLMGVALVMLAIQTIENSPSKLNIVLLGIAVGLAMSAKYIGIVMIFPAAAMLISSRVKWTEGLICVLAATAVFLAINSPGLFGTSTLTDGFLTELQHVTTGHADIYWGPTSARTLIHFWHSTSPALIALWIAGMGLHLWQSAHPKSHPAANKDRRSSVTMDRIILFTPLLLLATIQMSMVSLSRYVLPATLTATIAAVWTAALLLNSTSSRAIRAAPIILLIIAATTTIASFTTAVSGMVDDPRARLGEWIAQNIPPDAKIATEYFTGLPTPERVAVDPTNPLLMQKIEIPFYHLGMIESLSELRKRGYTHIAISSNNYERFLDPRATLASAENIRMKRFYEEVFSSLTPLYEDTRTINNDWAATGRLLVYDIRTEAADRQKP